MTTIKQFLILVVCLFLYQSALAAADAKFTFEPFYVMETSLVRFPDLQCGE